MRCFWQLLTVCIVVYFHALAPLHAAGEQERRSLDELSTRVEEIEKALSLPDLSDEQINSLREKLELIRQESLSLANQVAPQVSDAEVKLKQLGEEPKDVEEADALAAERKSLNEELQDLQAIRKRLELTAVTASQLSSRAANIQRQHFYDRIFETSSSIFNLRLWSNGREGFSSFISSSQRIIGVWLGEIRSDGGTAGILALFALFGAAFFLGLLIRRFLSRIVGPNIAETEPATLSRLWRVFRGLLINTVAFTIATVGVGFVLSSAGMLPEKMRVLGIAFLNSGVFLIAVRSITRGVLAKNRREWRLAAVTDSQATRLKSIIDLGALIIAINILLNEMSVVVFAPVSASILFSAIITVLLAGCLFSALAVVKTRNEELSDEDTRPPLRRGSFKWLASIRWALWVIGIFCLVCVIFGYMSLGHFMMTQVAYSGISIAILYLAHHLVDELVNTGMQPGWTAGDFLRQNFGLSDKAVERIGLFLGTATDFLLVFIGLPIIVGQWALTRVDFHSWLVTLFFGFEVGGVHISLAKVLLAVAALVAGLVFTKLFTNWLDSRVLSRAQLNRGVRDSVRTATGWFGYVVAAILAFTFAGVDFSKIAIVAGALGVGIGFGLQSIVNNFVSGLILLAERPVKVGDWIKVTGGEGYVKKIKIRSTEIETFDKCSIIVPNSSLIAEPVQNWTHGDTMGRVKVPIGVSYDTDPEHLREVVYTCATAHDQVLAFPQPSVVFMGFGASSLDFELRCFIPDVDYVLAVASDLRFEIFKALKENDIEIPFPQTDLHIKDIGELKEALRNGTAKSVKTRTKKDESA
ncbi:MAG: mechanosensitive ion channel domain-containing protein [Hyphomicrobiales bacterium]